MKSSTISHVRIRFTLALLALAFLAAAGAALWQARQLDSARARLQADSQDLARLRSTIRQWQDQASAPASGAEPSAPAAPSRLRPEDRALEARNRAEIERLQSELSAAHIELLHLREQAATFEDLRRRDTASANDRFTTAQRDWQSRFDDLNRKLDAAQADSNAARQRASDLESALSSLKADQSAAASRQSDTIRLLSTLQDLNRRRESYIDSLLRRYRDISGQLHAMSNVLDSNRDQNSSPLGSAALARIDSTISAAEDDLRQVNELNLRFQQTEKKLPRP